MSILRCDCCGRPVDSECAEWGTRSGSGQQTDDMVAICAACAAIEAAEEELKMQMMTEQTERK